MALAFPNVEEGTSYGTPALKVKGKLFVRLREDPDSLVIKMPFEQREELMAGDPETYYITDHYRDYPWMRSMNCCKLLIAQHYPPAARGNESRPAPGVWTSRWSPSAFRITSLLEAKRLF